MSRLHARFWTGNGSRPTLADSGSVNGTRVGRWRVTGETALADDDVVGIGESVLVVRPTGITAAEISTDTATGARLVNRPPRIAGPDRLVEVIVPVEPAAPTGFRFPWLATLLPAALCGVLYFLLPGGYGVYLIAMLALSPLMALVNLISDRRTGRREYAQAMAAYRVALAAYEMTLARALAEEEVQQRQTHPDPTELLRRGGARTGRPAATLWERRRTDADFLVLRVGLGERPARLVLRPDPAAGAAAGTRHRQPSRRCMTRRSRSTWPGWASSAWPAPGR